MDRRYAWITAARQLRRRPGFTLAAVALLSLGIAANTVVFSLIATIFLKPLPFPDSNRLVFLFESNPGKQEGRSLVAPVRLRDWGQRTRSFAAVSGYYSDTRTDRTGSKPERVRALDVAPHYFQVFATQPLLGRAFSHSEQTFGGPHAAILTDHFWQGRFGRSPHVLGKQLRLGNDSYTVVGVMPDSSVTPNIDLWLPAALSPYLEQARDARFYVGVGRLKPAVTISQAEQDLAALQTQFGEQYPNTDRGWSVTASNMQREVAGDSGRFLFTAFGAVGLLLVLACTNLAALITGQVYRREHEFSVRIGLGATRLNLAAMLLREISLLVLAGMALGVYFSTLVIAEVPKFATTIPRVSELTLDWRSLLFSAASGGFAAVAVGLAPAFQAGRNRFSKGLGQRSITQTVVQQRAQQWLVLGQFALTVVLLVSSGLLLRTYRELTQLNPGYRADHVLTFHVSAEWAEDRTVIGRQQQELLAALQSTPGISAAGVTNFLPTDDATLRYQYQVEGISSAEPKGTFTAGSRTVSGGYLASLQVPTLAGGSCPAQLPGLDSQPRAVLNRSFVDRFLHGRNPIGLDLRVLGTDMRYSAKVIGVVADLREDNLKTAPSPYVYLCAVAGGWPDPDYTIRTQGDPAAYTNTVRQIVSRVAPTRALFGVETLQAHLDTSLQRPYLTGQVLSGFAAVAVFVAACGLYGLCSLAVNARKREIGTRMALGAGPGQVLQNIFGSAARLLGAGLLIGFVLAVAAARLLQSVLFHVAVLDGPTFVGSALIMLTVGFAAMLAPALKAANIDPVKAIREE